MECSIIDLYCFLKNLLDYEEGLYLEIKSLIFYKFKDYDELRSAVDDYTNSRTFEDAYR